SRLPFQQQLTARLKTVPLYKLRTQWMERVQTADSHSTPSLRSVLGFARASARTGQALDSAGRLPRRSFCSARSDRFDGTGIGTAKAVSFPARTISLLAA